MDRRLWLARAIWFLHTSIVLLFAIGWALPWRNALWAVVVAAALVQVGWWIFGDRCLLTVAESRLRGASDEEPEGAEARFVGDLAARILGWRPADRWLDLATYGVMWGACAIAALRLGLGR